MSNMQAIAYLRVSTREQDDSGLGLAAQETACRRACEERGWTLIGVETDVASGGSTNGRHGLKRAQAALMRGEVGALVVAKLDRLARSTIDFVGIAERSRREGWALLVCDCAQLDPLSPMGEAMLQILSTFAQLERRMISERTSAALAAKRAQGWVPAGRRAGSREVPELIRQRIVEMREGGLSYRAIATALSDEGVPAPRAGRWNQETVRRTRLA